MQTGKPAENKLSYLCASPILVQSKGPVCWIGLCSPPQTLKQEHSGLEI